MKKTFLILALSIASISMVQAEIGTPAPKDKAFTKNASECLAIMEKAAQDMSITGVAMIAFVPGDVTESWMSEMKVIGRLATKDINFLGVVYAKAAEMAVTLQNSGDETRKDIIGETGWRGGAIVKVESGYLIAAFSGGTGEQDVAVSKAGLEWLAKFF
jgi:hypothetical protein